jgi:hypothetical protein
MAVLSSDFSLEKEREDVRAMGCISIAAFRSDLTPRSIRLTVWRVVSTGSVAVSG